MGSIKVQLLETTAALITSAFALVAALAWNEAIKTAIQQVFDSGDNLIGFVVYAIIVTVIAVLASVGIAFLLAKAKEQMHAE